MVSYSQKEMVGITELSKSLSGFIDKVSSKAVEKLAIIKHNKAEAVIISIDEYERMKEFQDYLEDLEIANIIKERVLDKKEPIKTISWEEMKQRLRARGKNV
ncbi:type II toxin-antitoxin system Phd/YefM family antitoxin [Arcobacter vandammei]|uniref:type II toxin-antitoxin system Phd/YefM family antitoxin n=1 Tax=Arcobacter vandammei TaxID=2782243 RepID=UPI0018DF189C|nr:type II toxin-antitoxin system Phd/YefM family antitoxin [Arcobacter vandammei]